MKVLRQKLFQTTKKCTHLSVKLTLRDLVGVYSFALFSKTQRYTVGLRLKLLFKIKKYCIMSIIIIAILNFIKNNKFHFTAALFVRFISLISTIAIDCLS